MRTTGIFYKAGACLGYILSPRSIRSWPSASITDHNVLIKAPSATEPVTSPCQKNKHSVTVFVLVPPATS